MKKTLLYSALLLVFLGMTNNLVAQEKGLFSIFTNFGGGSLEDKDATVIADSTEYDVDTVKINVLKLSLGINYAHPISKMFSIGAMAELRLLFNNSEYKADIGTISISSSLNSTGLGFAVGPYFRLGLWGADKKGGIGFAPYFLINSLRPEANNTLNNPTGTDYKWKDDSVLGLGGGLMVDIYFIKNFGLNLGFELEFGDFNSTFTEGANGGGASSPFGAVFYGGIVISF